MSLRDPEAWWSPVPGSPPNYLTEPSAYGSDPPPTWAGAAAPPPTAPPPAAPRRRRRRPWVVGGAALLVVAGTVLLATLGPSATKTLTDPTRTVSVEVPRSWYDNTGEPSSNPDEPPLLAASNLWQDRYVVVGRWAVSGTDTLRSFQSDGIDSECAQQRCSERGTPETTTVSGHDALEQVVVHPAEQGTGASTAVVLTVWLDDHAIELYASATAGGSAAPDRRPLQEIAASLRLL